MFVDTPHWSGAHFNLVSSSNWPSVSKISYLFSVPVEAFSCCTGAQCLSINNIAAWHCYYLLTLPVTWSTVSALISLPLFSISDQRVPFSTSFATSPSSHILLLCIRDLQTNKLTGKAAPREMVVCLCVSQRLMKAFSENI